MASIDKNITDFLNFAAFELVLMDTSGSGSLHSMEKVINIVSIR